MIEAGNGARHPPSVQPRNSEEDDGRIKESLEIASTERSKKFDRSFFLAACPLQWGMY
jgi:hypothetical protein